MYNYAPLDNQPPPGYQNQQAFYQGGNKGPYGGVGTGTVTPTGSIVISPIFDTFAPGGSRFPDDYVATLMGRISQAEFTDVMGNVNRLMWNGFVPIQRQMRVRNYCLLFWICGGAIAMGLMMGLRFANPNRNILNESVTDIILPIVIPTGVMFVMVIVVVCLGNRGLKRKAQMTHESVKRYFAQINVNYVPRGVQFRYVLSYDMYMVASQGRVSSGVIEKPHIELDLMVRDAPAAPHEAQRMSGASWLQEVEVNERIGGGHFGEVYRGTWQRTTTVALKKLNEATGPARAFEREATLLQSLRHPNVVMFLGLSQQNDSAFLVTEFMPSGDLGAALARNQPLLTTVERARISADAAAGVSFLHSKAIIHRDLAARNFFLLSVDGHWSVKVGDFGMAHVLGNDDTWTAPATDLVSPGWAAPEVLRARRFSRKSDSFSFGVVLWEIFCSGGNQPWANIPAADVKGMIDAGERLPVALNRADQIQSSVSDIIVSCFDNDAEERLTLRQIHTRLSTFAGAPPAEAPPSYNSAMPIVYSPMAPV